MFMHGGLLHLGGNMLFLWIFGNNVEDSMGPVKFVIFYVLGGLAALALQVLTGPNSQIPTLGASGAIAGVLGGYILLFPRAKVVTVIFIVFFFTILELPALLVLGLWFLQQAVMGYFDLARAGRRAAAWRTSPTSAGSSSACWPFVYSRVNSAPNARTSVCIRGDVPAPIHRRCSRSCCSRPRGYLLLPPRRRLVAAGRARPRRTGALEDSLDGAAGRRRHRALAARRAARRRASTRSRSSSRSRRKSALVFDLDTGKVLWRRDPTAVLPIASLTKMMTALVVVERVPEGSKVKITNEALRYSGSGVGVLPRGKWIGVNTMLHGLMLPSGNDAAIALAQRAARRQREALRALHEREGQAARARCARASPPPAASRTRATTRAPPTSPRSPAP